MGAECKTQLSPRAVSIGKSSNLIIQGAGLNTVTAVSFEPPEGIIITGAINVNTTGDQLIVPVQIAIDANQSTREVILSTSNNSISFAPQSQRQLLIAGLTPSIFSISPIQQTQGSSFSLKIRGINLDTTPVITASPATGISFTAPSINSTGTELTTTMIISPNATMGTRIITVTTPAGSTQTNAVPANTFTIIN